MSGKTNKMLQKAEEALGRGAINKAKLLYREVLEVEPANCEALTKTGQLLIIQERPAEAQEYLKKASAADPKNLEVLYALGLCLQARHLDRDAILCFEKALALDPKHAEMLACAGFSCQRSGDLKAAKSYY